MTAALAFSNSFARVSLTSGAALALHLAVAWGVVSMQFSRNTPPRVSGSFEVVDLTAYEKAERAVTPPAPPPEVPPAKPLPPEPVEPVIEAPEAVVPEFPAPRRKPIPPVKRKAQVKPELKKIPSKIKAVKTTPSAAFIPPDIKAAYLNNPKPFYPLQARRRGMEGLVLLLVNVGVKGLALSVSVKKSSGFKILDLSAVSTVQRWRFIAATRAGRPVRASVDVPVRFRLH